MALWITDSGANTAEIGAGTRAAMAYFRKLGLEPSAVWIAMNAGPDNEPPVSADDQDAAIGFWREAETVAFRAAFATWNEWPESASLVWEG